MLVSEADVQDVYAGLVWAVGDLVLPGLYLLVVQLRPVGTLHHHGDATVTCTRILVNEQV